MQCRLLAFMLMSRYYKSPVVKLWTNPRWLSLAKIRKIITTFSTGELVSFRMRANLSVSFSTVVINWNCTICE